MTALEKLVGTFLIGNTEPILKRFSVSEELFNKEKNEALQNFVQRHRPTYEWLRKHPKEEDIKYYINEKLKEDKKRN